MGRPGADGVGKEHVFGDVVLSDCTDPAELLRLTREELVRRCKPRVSYVVDSACVEGIALGSGTTSWSLTPCLWAGAWSSDACGA